MSVYRILISGNPAEWCDCLVAAFKRNKSFEVVGCVPFPELVGTAGTLYPDVVLWKVNDGNPIKELCELKDKSPFSLTVTMVRDPGEYDLLELVKAGVKGCLPLRLLPMQIVNAVELIVAAGMLCLPRLSPGFNHCSNSARRYSLLDTLTEREREVLKLLDKDLSNKDIAAALYLSESTVKSHLRSIFRKLGVRKRRDALKVVREELRYG